VVSAVVSVVVVVVVVVVVGSVFGGEGRVSEALLGESRVEWCWLAGVPRHVVVAARAVYGRFGADGCCAASSCAVNSPRLECDYM
jgi:hypothetical protein